MIKATNIITGNINDKGKITANINGSIIDRFPELEDLEVTPTTEEQNFKADKYGFDNVKVKAIEGDTLDIVPSTEDQTFSGVYENVNVSRIQGEDLEVTPSLEEQAFTGVYENVTVKRIETEDLEATPSIEEQNFTGVYENVKVNKITSDLIPNLTPDIIAEGEEVLDLVGTHKGGLATKGVFEGEVAKLPNAIEDAVIEEFGVTGISTQDTSLNLQNVNGDIVVKVTNGTEEQTVIFPLGEQKLMKGSYLADDGIHHRRKQIVLNSSNINMVSFIIYDDAVPRIGIGKIDLGWQEVWDNGVSIVNGYKEISAYGNIADHTFATNFQMGFLNIWNSAFTSLEVARNLLIGTVIEIEQVNEYVIPYTTSQQVAWNKLKQLTTYAGTTTVTTTNETKPVLSGKYHMTVPEFPIGLTGEYGNLLIDSKENRKNLFDINSKLEDLSSGGVPTRVNGNQIIIPNNEYNNFSSLFDYIPVEENKNINISFDLIQGAARIGLRLYDESKSLIDNSNLNLPHLYYNSFYQGYFYDGNNVNTTIPEGVKYIRVLTFALQGTKENIYENFQIEYGTEATEYEPYTPPLYIKHSELDGTIQIKLERKNLLDLSKWSLENCSLNSDGKSITSKINNGYYSAIKTTTLNDFLLKNKGKTITFSTGTPIEGKSTSIVIEGARTSGINYQEETNGGTGYCSLTIAEDFTSIDYLELRFNRTFPAFTDTSTVINYAMLELGEVATEYAPYTNLQITDDNTVVITVVNGDKTGISLA